MVLVLADAYEIAQGWARSVPLPPDRWRYVSGVLDLWGWDRTTTSVHRCYGYTERPDCLRLEQLIREARLPTFGAVAREGWSS
jgi:hypothetical protein